MRTYFRIVTWQSNESGAVDTRVTNRTLGTIFFLTAGWGCSEKWRTQGFCKAVPGLKKLISGSAGEAVGLRHFFFFDLNNFGSLFQIQTRGKKKKKKKKKATLNKFMGGGGGWCTPTHFPPPRALKKHCGKFKLWGTGRGNVRLHDGPLWWQGKKSNRLQTGVLHGCSHRNYCLSAPAPPAPTAPRGLVTNTCKVKYRTLQSRGILPLTVLFLKSPISIWITLYGHFDICNG